MLQRLSSFASHRAVGAFGFKPAVSRVTPQLVSRYLASAPDNAHPDDCTCAICGKKDEIKAIYMENKEKMLFTGIAQKPNGQYIKLDDPFNKERALDGPGHVMTDEEYVTEMNTYVDDDDDDKMELPIRTDAIKGLLDCTNKPVLDIQDCLYRLPRELDYDEMFPFPDSDDYIWGPWRPKRLRAQDVVILVAKPLRGRDGELQFFHALVLSVSITDIVTAVSLADVSNIRVKEGDVLAFPITRVVAMKKGEHWKKRKRHNRAHQRR